MGSRSRKDVGGVDFEILGPLRVSVDGAEVVVGSARQRTLLAALLVVGGSVVSADRLAEILWGQEQPQDPGQALQTQVSRLRGVLDRAAGGGVRDLLVNPVSWVCAAGRCGPDRCRPFRAPG